MGDSQGDEALFRAELAAILKEELKDELAKCKLALEEDAKVLYDLTATVENGDFKPRLGFLEQDIVVFSEARGDPSLARYFRMTMDLTKVRIPRLIIETKYKGITSHALMAYSNIASKIKGIFTNSKYYLLLRYDNKNASTLLRHGTGFDRIVQLEKYKATETVGRYIVGALKKDLAAGAEIRACFEKLVQTIKADLADEKLIF